MKTLRKRLKDWMDIDGAIWEVGACLGMVPEFPENRCWGELKWVVWSNNPTGNAMSDVMFRLIDEGVLERDMEGQHDRVRWNPNWKIKEE